MSFFLRAHNVGFLVSLYRCEAQSVMLGVRAQLSGAFGAERSRDSSFVSMAIPIRINKKMDCKHHCPNSDISWDRGDTKAHIERDVYPDAGREPYCR